MCQENIRSMMNDALNKIEELGLEVRGKTEKCVELHFDSNLTMELKDLGRNHFSVNFSVNDRSLLWPLSGRIDKTYILAAEGPFNVWPLDNNKVYYSCHFVEALQYLKRMTKV